ncbi:hypothetical protein LXL04_007833 [Taraxacum kok-saghyz]
MTFSLYQNPPTAPFSATWFFRQQQTDDQRLRCPNEISSGVIGTREKERNRFKWKQMKHQALPGRKLQREHLIDSSASSEIPPPLGVRPLSLFSLPVEISRLSEPFHHPQPQHSVEPYLAEVAPQGEGRSCLLSISRERVEAALVPYTRTYAQF